MNSVVENSMVTSMYVFIYLLKFLDSLFNCDFGSLATVLWHMRTPLPHQHHWTPVSNDAGSEYGYSMTSD